MSPSQLKPYNGHVKLQDIGEFGLLQLLARMVEEAGLRPQDKGARLRLGIGDDAALWDSPQATHLLTTDTLVQGIHFTQETTPWRDLGWKMMVANLSDVAAMGGTPRYAVVTLGLPPDTQVIDVEELYHGMLEACRRYPTGIVGGDVVRSPVPFVTVALTGVCSGPPLTRSAARRGDAIAVTGPLGSSAGGLEVLLQHLQVPADPREHLVQAHRRPHPCLEEGQILGALGIRCAMDISDGLIDDLSKLCQASGVAARLVIDHVPVHPLLQEAFPQDYLRLALHGGEDYQLLFTGPPATVTKALTRLPQGAQTIGEILAGEPGRVMLVDGAGREVATPGAGWDHFRRPS